MTLIYLFIETRTKHKSQFEIYRWTCISSSVPDRRFPSFTAFGILIRSFFDKQVKKSGYEKSLPCDADTDPWLSCPLSLLLEFRRERAGDEHGDHPGSIRLAQGF
jgi:hypothetical protein